MSNPENFPKSLLTYRCQWPSLYYLRELELFIATATATGWRGEIREPWVVSQNAHKMRTFCIRFQGSAFTTCIRSSTYEFACAKRMHFDARLAWVQAPPAYRIFTGPLPHRYRLLEGRSPRPKVVQASPACSNRNPFDLCTTTKPKINS
jgi:hypothetical protein